MRQLLTKYSYSEISGFYPYRWIPFTAYQAFRSEWDELAAEFIAVKLDILDHYEEYKQLLAADFAEIALSAWRSLTASQPADRRPTPKSPIAERTAAERTGDARPIAVTIDQSTYTDPAAFSEAITSRALAKLPTPAEIEANLSADYTTALVYGEQDVAADQLAADHIHQQIDLERAAARAEQQERYAQANLFEEQTRHQVQIDRLAEEEKRIQLDAMRQAEAEHARARLQEMVSPFEAVFSSLRRRLADDARSMLESIRKNSYVRGKIAEKGRGLLDFYQLMAVHDDRQLRDLLIALKAEIGPIGDERPAGADRDVAEITGLLSQIDNLAHTAAADLTRGPSRFSFIEI